jgi:hypothetical protein
LISLDEVAERHPTVNPITTRNNMILLLMNLLTHDRTGGAAIADEL